jgi:hypothetical protein
VAAVLIVAFVPDPGCIARVFADFSAVSWKVWISERVRKDIDRDFGRPFEAV